MNGNADRNFSTLKFLFGIAARKGNFIIRQHQCLPWHPINEFRPVGRVDSGQVFEQTILLSDDDGELLQVRRVKVQLEQPTLERATGKFLSSPTCQLR